MECGLRGRAREVVVVVTEEPWGEQWLVSGRYCSRLGFDQGLRAQVGRTAEENSGDWLFRECA